MASYVGEENKKEEYNINRSMGLGKYLNELPDSYASELKINLEHMLAKPAPEITIIDGFVSRLNGYKILMNRAFLREFNNLFNQAVSVSGKEHIYPYCLGQLLSRVEPTYGKVPCRFCGKEIKEKDRWHPKLNQDVYLGQNLLCHKKCYEEVLKEQKARNFVNESAKEIPEASEIGDIVEQLKKAKRI